MGIPSNDQKMSQKSNKLSIGTYNEDAGYNNNLPTTSGLKSLSGNTFTSPLLLSKQSTADCTNNIVLPSISSLKNQPSFNSERTAISPKTPYMQYKNISPIAESKIRTTIERPSSISLSHGDSNTSENGAANIDKSYFQPLLPPSAIPIKSSQGSIVEDPNTFNTQRKSSLNFNMFSTPMGMPSLIFPTPFLNAQSPLIFPNTFPDSNVLPPITPKFSMTGDVSVNLKRPSFSQDRRPSCYVLPEIKSLNKQVYKKNFMETNYDIEKAMKSTKNVKSEDEMGEKKVVVEDVLSPLEVPIKPKLTKNKKVKSTKHVVNHKKQELLLLSNVRTDNRQRTGSSCNLCQFKKCKCNANIEILFQDEKVFKLHQDMKSNDVDSKLHFAIDLTTPEILASFKKWLIEKNIKIPKEIKHFKAVKSKNVAYYKHLNCIIKITSCTNCIDYQVGCFFKYGYSKEDKRLCYKLNLKVKNTYHEEKEKFLKGNVSQLPTESCYLGKLTISDYYKHLGL